MIRSITSFLPRSELARQINIPLEAVIVHPPDAFELAVGDFLTVHIQPAFVEQAGELQMHRTLSLGRVELQIGLVPGMPGIALELW